MDLMKLASDVANAAEELIKTAGPKPGRIFVLGCSTSEVLGSKIGTARSPETAEAIISALMKVTKKHGLYLAVQCCEHLNRALVVEEEAAERFRPDPDRHASETGGGSRTAFGKNHR